MCFQNVIELLQVCHFVFNIDVKDVWHAKKRIVSCLSAQHADYQTAKTELKAIFAKLQLENGYPTKKAFRKALKDWCNHYSDPSLIDKLSEHEQIELLGTSSNDIPNCVGQILNNKTIQRSSDVLTSGCVPLINDKAIAAVKIMTEEPVLSSLFNIKLYIDFGTQGTSILESLNNHFSASKSRYSSGMTWEVLMIYISSIVYKHNFRYVI